MPYYICNKNIDDKGRHEIHTTSCNHLPLEKNRIDAGHHNDCKGAIQQMENANPGGKFNFDGCAYCCPLCHKG